MKNYIKSIVFLFALLLILFSLFPFPLNKMDNKFSQVIYDRNNEILRVFLSKNDMLRFKVEYSELPSRIIDLLLFKEDRFFYYHLGVNPVSILRAAKQNLFNSRVVSGASTITMQVVRLYFPRKRTFFNKFIEAFQAIELELAVSKKDVLTYYFNQAPYGGNIVGIKAAAYKYFGKKKLRELSIGEMALLVILPQSPNRFNPVKNPLQAKKQRDNLLKAYYQSGKISFPIYQKAIKEELPKKLTPSPFYAPHFCEMIHKKYYDNYVKTTIDKRLQLMCEDIAKNKTPVHYQENLHSGIIVIKNNDNSVLAWVGSRDYFESKEGQNNAPLQLRSPGSTLKPFIYAIAIEKGFIAEKTKLFDFPRYFGDYHPLNFQGKYYGLVSVREALIRSLNVPAVEVLQDITPKTFYERMHLLGFTSLRDPVEKYGLSMALGGCDVNLVELTNAYATLANYGKFREYKLLMNEDNSFTRTVIDSGSVYIITNILQDVYRPDLPRCWEFTMDLPAISWKTGTSFRFRDAWAVGFNKEYTVGIWCGNFMSKSVRGITGYKTAAPLLFDIFRGLNTNKFTLFKKPSNVGNRLVCSLSGMPAKKICPHTEKELFLKNITFKNKCSYHFVSLDKYKSGIVTVYPPLLLNWMRKNNMPESSLFTNKAHVKEGKIKILLPLNKTSYYLPLTDSETTIYVKGISNEATTLYWFLDDQFLFSTKNNEKRMVKVKKGLHILICKDKFNKTDEVEFEIINKGVVK